MNVEDYSMLLSMTALPSAGSGPGIVNCRILDLNSASEWSYWNYIRHLTKERKEKSTYRI